MVRSAATPRVSNHEAMECAMMISEWLIVVAAAITLRCCDVTILDIVVLDRGRRRLLRFAFILGLFSLETFSLETFSLGTFSIFVDSAHDVPLIGIDRRHAALVTH
jgi:hypothetical protein